MIRRKTRQADPKPVRILVVDDESGPRDVLKTALFQEGYEVRCAEGGRRALDLFEKEKFDLLLVDIKMPDMSGIDLLRKVQERSPETLVILITGYASLDSAMEAIRAGAYDYLTKPFRIDELYIVVKNAVDRIRLLKENQMLISQLRKGYKGTEMETVKVGGSREDSNSNELELLRALQYHLLKIYTRSSSEDIESK